MTWTTRRARCPDLAQASRPRCSRFFEVFLDAPVPDPASGASGALPDIERLAERVLRAAGVLRAGR